MSSVSSTEEAGPSSRVVLERRTIAAVQASTLPATAFFLAGIAVVLARLRNQPLLTLAHAEGTLTVTVDTALPFNALLTQVEEMLTAPLAAQLPGGPPADAPADAWLELDGRALDNPALCPQDVPRFAAWTGSWTLGLTVPGWAGPQTERMLGYWKALLESAAADPRQPAGTLRVIDEAAALERYRELNRTRTVFPEAAAAGTTVLDLFARSAADFPVTEAVVFAAGDPVAGEAADGFDGERAGGPRTRLSYAELDRKSTALAMLLAARGASQERPVAVCLPRSAQVPVVQLAAMKADSYFVPLDPSHPKQRLIDILEECRPAVVVVAGAARELFAGTSLPLLEPDMQVPGPEVPGLEAPGSEAPEMPGPLANRPSPAGKAYMIYTSGTTGRPKGVMVSHGALANALLAMRERPGMERGDRMLAVASLSFDISLLDIFLPLISGATLVMAPESAARDPWALARLLDASGATCMQATPVTWRMLLAAGYRRDRPGQKGLKMLSGGEALPRDLAEGLLALGGELWNCYGPTETTIYSCVLRVGPGEGPVAIGPPLANTVFYLADARGQLLPPEMPGELYIGGSGVADGYFERPELNRERFLDDHWSELPEARLFRTGDLVRLADEGHHTFEFFGRIDHQVKLRGYRIELGEIESVLRSYPPVGDAAVVLREDEPGEPWLVAYVTHATRSGTAAGNTENDTATKDLLAYAALSLPAYMLPARVVTLPALPLTGSGKVDRRALGALPAPEEVEAMAAAAPSGQAAGSEAAAGRADGRAGTPMDAMETALLRIFREVLRLRSFGRDDNFFEHGGYSLLAIRLFAKIGTVLQRQLPITALFDAPTVRQLAELMRRGDPLQALVPIRGGSPGGGQQAPFFLLHSYLLYGLIGDVVPASSPVYGLRERSATSAPLELERCVAEYSDTIQHVWPAGPVHLGGWCAAATLTVEVARRLMEQGRQVGMLALFDAEAPGFEARPPAGSPRLARLRASWEFHQRRLNNLTWTEGLLYLQDRLRQAPANLTERFYHRHRAHLEGWQERFPWLPEVFFYNRFTQTGLLQTERIERVNARIQLFRAHDVTKVAGSDEALGWAGIGGLGVNVTFIPGHHESMFKAPNVAVLRKEFQAIMRNIEADLAA